MTFVINLNIQNVNIFYFNGQEQLVTMKLVLNGSGNSTQAQSQLIY